MRRRTLTVAIAALGLVGLAGPAWADPEGTKLGVYYDAVVLGQPVAEDTPGDVRVFVTCQSTLMAMTCDAVRAFPDQDGGVFAGNTSVDWSVRGDDTDYDDA